MTKVTLEKQGNIAVVTINRPEVHNCLDPETFVRLADAWEEVRDSDDIRVAILTGTGAESFSAGADLGRMITLVNGSRKPEDEWDDKFLKNVGLMDLALLRDFDTVKPVIAAINGKAIAGGMEMVQGTDIRVSSNTAQFGLQEVKWSLFPMGGSTARLPRQMPYCRAMEILLTGDLISAQEAYELGFLNHVVPQGEVMDKSLEIANKIAENGPVAVKQIRASARALIGLTEKEGLEKEKNFGIPVFMTKDSREGPKAFKEKRKPVFIGK